MNRLVWLLVALFCTAVAQVQPVDLTPGKDGECCCCGDQPGTCGMPDCTPAPTTAQPVLKLQTSVAAVQEARKASRPLSAHQEPFYVKFVRSSTVATGVRVAYAIAPTASASLYRDHCSFLL